MPRESARLSETIFLLTMLIEIDNRPIRRSYTARLRRARRAITRMQSQIARDHEVDAPAFYLWYHREFGQILSHHRRLREQIAAHEFVERNPEDRTIDRTDTGFSRPKTPATEASPEYDPSAAEYPPDTPEADDDFSPETREPHRECQRLFRRIALQLHPDRGGPLVDGRKLWWLHAQAAYEHGDLVALRLILSRCEPPRRTITMSCAQILEMIQETRNRAEALIGLRTRLRRESALRFTAKSDPAPASLRVRPARELSSVGRALVFRLPHVASA